MVRKDFVMFEIAAAVQIQKAISGLPIFVV
jgi:hypothetical protein